MNNLMNENAEMHPESEHHLQHDGINQWRLQWTVAPTLVFNWTDKGTDGQMDV